MLLLVAAGYSSTEIGTRIHVGDETVKTHVSRILGRLDLRDRVHAVVYAHRHGPLTWRRRTESCAQRPAPTCDVGSVAEGISLRIQSSRAGLRTSRVDPMSWPIVRAASSGLPSQIASTMARC